MKTTFSSFSAWSGKHCRLIVSNSYRHSPELKSFERLNPSPPSNPRTYISQSALPFKGRNVNPGFRSSRFDDQHIHGPSNRRGCLSHTKIQARRACANFAPAIFAPAHISFSPNNKSVQLQHWADESSTSCFQVYGRLSKDVDWRIGGLFWLLSIRLQIA
jgi:hypothetical protein